MLEHSRNARQVLTCTLQYTPGSSAGKLPLGPPTYGPPSPLRCPSDAPPTPLRRPSDAPPMPKKRPKNGQKTPKRRPQDARKTSKRRPKDAHTPPTRRPYDANTASPPAPPPPPPPPPPPAPAGGNHGGRLQRAADVGGQHEDMMVDEEEAGAADPANRLPPYIIDDRRYRMNLRYGVEERIFRVKFRPEYAGRRLIDLHNQLYEMFEAVLNRIRGLYDPMDRVRMYIDANNLRKYIVIHLRPLRTWTVEAIMARIDKILQSDENIPLDASFFVSVGIQQYGDGLRGPDEGGSGTEQKVAQATKRFRFTNLDPSDRFNDVFKRKCIIRMTNADNLCVSRSLVICKARAEKSDDYKTLIHKSSTNSMGEKGLRRRALELQQKAGFAPDESVLLHQLHKFEDAMDAKIYVIDAKQGMKLVYGREDIIRDRTTSYYLFKLGNHVHPIVNIAAFWSKGNFCHHCQSPFTRAKSHSCPMHCTVCLKDGCQLTDNPVPCEECGFVARSSDCYVRHKQSTGNYTKGIKKGKAKPSPCEKYWKCRLCKRSYERVKESPDNHNCNSYHCRTCKQSVPLDHLCYLRAIPKKETTGKFIFFDFECTQDTMKECEAGYCPKPQENCFKCKQSAGTCADCRLCRACDYSFCGTMMHMPNLVVSQSSCSHCKDKMFDFETSKCVYCGSRCSLCSMTDPKSKMFKRPPCPETCGHRERVFKGFDCSEKFCKWLCSKAHWGFTVIAHNGKGYDFHFIIHYLLANAITPMCIFSGSKIMYMKIAAGLNISFLDSLNFLPMALTKLSSAFSLPDVKGYFPHLFNTKINTDYNGHMPDPHYYQPDFMSEQGRDQFYTWYGQQKGKTFNLQEEMLVYCRKDTSLLRTACNAFRDRIFELTSGGGKGKGVDAFSYITLASLTMGVYKSLFMTETCFVEEQNGQSRFACKRNGGFWQIDDKGGVGEKMEISDGMKVTFVKSPLPQMPAQGYTGRGDNYSSVSIKWIKWIEHESGRHLQHALSDKGEYRVQVDGTTYRADGYDATTNTIYEFYGYVYILTLKRAPLL